MDKDTTAQTGGATESLEGLIPPSGTINLLFGPAGTGLFYLAVPLGSVLEWADARGRLADLRLDKVPTADAAVTAFGTWQGDPRQGRPASADRIGEGFAQAALETDAGMDRLHSGFERSENVQECGTPDEPDGTAPGAEALASPIEAPAKNRGGRPRGRRNGGPGRFQPARP